MQQIPDEVRTGTQDDVEALQAEVTRLKEQVFRLTTALQRDMKLIQEATAKMQEAFEANKRMADVLKAKGLMDLATGNLILPH